MLLLTFGIILFLVVIVYLIYVSMQTEKPEDKRPTIHTSGIYSVVRRSPRGAVEAVKPSHSVLGKNLANASVDVLGKPLSAGDKKRLLDQWQANLESNLRSIESGDQNGIEIYFYSSFSACSQNGMLHGRNRFVTREEIYQNPELVPPFHLGCRCGLVPDTEWKRGGRPDEKVLPLLDGQEFHVPNWKTIERGVE